MHVLKLKVSDQVFDKFIWLLDKFSADEIEVISEDAEFSQNRKYLESEYDDIRAGKANFVSIEEAEKRLENTIKKHEDSI